ncbi:MULTISPECIES: hypothetical protein [Achromobacter]|nr:hypothetical protein [Achromobacter sp. SD115]
MPGKKAAGKRGVDAAKSVSAFIDALARHHHPERETSPPMV